MIITNQAGLVFSFSQRGSVRSIEVDPIRIGLRSHSVLSRTGANLYLRKRGSPLTYTPLLGPESRSRFRASGRTFEATGSWSGLDYACVLALSPDQLSWQWSVRVESRLDHPVEVDLVYVQDVGLKTIASGLVNEHYVSQYIERRVLAHARYGSVVCCRQNMRESTGHPWLMIASTTRAIAASTDGLQLYGSTYRSTGMPEALSEDRLGGELSGESSIVAIQEQPFVLGAAESRTSAFVATYVPDHPPASSELDLVRLPEVVRAFSAPPPPISGAYADPAQSRFQCTRLFAAEDLSEAERVELFGSTRRHAEELEGRLLSFFTDGPHHVVLREKELRVDRPHGHIMQAHSSHVPDARTMSTTAFACGVFCSHLTQGNTNFDTLLSVCTNPVMPALDAGQRILVGLDDGEYLLGVPSAFEMGLNHCRWIYKRGPTCLEVCTWTATDAPRIHVALKVLRGGPVRLTLTHHFDALNGWTVVEGDAHEHIARPRADSLLARRAPEARFRIVVEGASSPYCAQSLALTEDDPQSFLFVLDVEETSAFCMSFLGEVSGATDARPIDDPDTQRRTDCEAAVAAWRALSRDLTLRGGDEIGAIAEILPWYGLNALVHYLTPYGLEQFSGAAWGTRDVCQGPLDLLLCEEKHDAAKQVLRILFSSQNPDGGWPQWWMFDRYASVRADGAHGDVVYWCILALCSYVRATGDLAILDERLPYFREGGADPETATPIREHVDRIIALVAGSFVPGTALVPFGGGDWNDSLQPVSRDLAQRLISSWTVQMSYQAFREYGELCERAGHADEAQKLRDLCERISTDFHRHLVRDGVVAGYGLVGADQTIDVLLHPTDTMTGVRYSLLPMNRGVISGLFSKQQAEQHLALIERHLKGPDGARLMDRPLRYRGGPQTIFQRAESSTYFGREIGLMYVHEHLRYAETQARMGRADAFLHALRQAIPVGYREVVPQGALRQANCYYSSSDVAFESRYEADERYGDVVAGKLPLRGGWRVYSSGPGIYIGLVVSRLLGLRIELDSLVIDPVLARSLDGLEATLRLRGHPVTFVYRVTGDGFAPHAISVNGRAVAFEREDSPYRQGGAVLPLTQFLAMLAPGPNTVEVVV